MEMSTTGYYLAALLVGIVAGVYLPLNGRFGEQLGSPLLATAIFFSVGAMTALALWLFLGDGGGVERLKAAQLPYFALGMISFGIIFCATFFIPRMGPGAYFVCLVAGQVFAGLVLSHFGLLAPEKLPLTPLKVLGAVAVIAGVILIRYSEGQQTSQASQSSADRESSLSTNKRS